jgi:DNA ligase D-like protein (predicted 3'-phosphoesterase)
VDGVLVSWAVPKGPSTNPDEQRLAVRTEDHPLEYADFEGHIPASGYGGGEVIVWDLGAYRNLTSDDEGEAVGMAEALEAGHARVWLEGGKLRGGYTLTHARIGGDDRNWLLAKVRDEGADARRNPVRTEPESVLTDRTVDEVAAEGE